MEVPIPYWLFSHTKMTGSFQSAAMLTASKSWPYVQIIASREMGGERCIALSLLGTKTREHLHVASSSPRGAIRTTELSDDWAVLHS